MVVRRCGLYDSTQRLLVVGDGNFTFSLSLGQTLGGEQLTATSLQSDFSEQPYTRETIDKLRSSTKTTIQYVWVGRVVRGAYGDDAVWIASATLSYP